MGYVRLYQGKELKKQFELTQERITIGRTDDNILVLADDGVSRHHAAIEYQDGDYYIVDLGSSNGVFLNNKRVEREQLKYWDEVQIHNFVIKFMAKPGIGVSNEDDSNRSSDLEEDKTKFFKVTDEKQLDELRNKTKECFLTYTDSTGAKRKPIIKKPRVIIGKGSKADIKIKGWFAPAVAATIERQGGHYELVPGKRGKVVYQNKHITESAKLHDGSGFIVRDMEFTFYNRLTKTS